MVDVETAQVSGAGPFHPFGPAPVSGVLALEQCEAATFVGFGDALVGVAAGNR
jgi:hypothetical protein